MPHSKLRLRKMKAQKREKARKAWRIMLRHAPRLSFSTINYCRAYFRAVPLVGVDYSVSVKSWGYGGPLDFEATSEYHPPRS